MPDTFGARLKTARKKRGMTQTEIADGIGYKKAAVSIWEHGRSMPSISVVETIARILNVSTGYLLGYSDDPEDWEAVAADLDIPQAIWDVSEDAEDAVKRYQALQDDQEREAALSSEVYPRSDSGPPLDTSEQALIDTYRTLNAPGKEAAYAAVQGIAANPKFQSECDNAGLDPAQQAV